jgi:hypothetical protein
MAPEEYRLHATMRNYTATVLSEYNKKALSLIEQHPSLQEKIPRLKELWRHLNAWQNKYENVFKYAPSIGLIYVGVVEKIPFPKGIEVEIEEYIQTELKGEKVIK